MGEKITDQNILNLKSREKLMRTQTFTFTYFSCNT